MRRNEYLGNVIFSDPTANEAIGHISSSRATEVTRLSTQLRELWQQRRTKIISRQVFIEMRTPLAQRYRAINGTSPQERRQ